MNKKQNKLFKVVPFCISLLIVFLITGGIALYTTTVYRQTKFDFVDGYFSEEETKNLTNVDYINRALELQYAKYADATTVSNISYFDKDFDAITDSGRTNYKNGVLHVDGYFDVYLSVIINDAKNSDDRNVVYALNFFNVDYTNIGLETANAISDNRLRVVFANGVNDKAKDEYSEDETTEGRARVEELLETKSYSSFQAIGLLTYTISLGEGKPAYPADILDRGAELGNLENVKPNILSSSFYTCGAPSQGLPQVDFEEDVEDSATFAVILVNEAGDDHTVLFNGTIENIVHNEDIEEAGSEVENKFNKGYNQKLHTVPGFFGYTWKTIVTFTSIAFVISVILASLFYLIWIDERTLGKQVKKNKKN